MTQTNLFILHGNKQQYPAIIDNVEWSTSRQGEPGKLTFKYKYDKDILVEEGDVVGFKWEDKNVFYGYIFTRSRTRDGEVECTAYDQLRYFKNTDSVTFVDSDAPDIFKLFRDTYGLVLGTIEDTRYKFSMVEDSATLFDMIGDFTDSVLIAKQRMYVMYDDYGEINFRDLESAMGVGYLLTAKTAGDYEYSTSIDDQTYNRIIIYNDEGQSDMAQDRDSIYKYGTLQYYESVDSIYDGLADDILELYNRPSKTLKITDAFGDVRVRGGTWIPVDLDLGDEVVSNVLIVEEATHKFNEGNYTMDLTLVGGKGFVA